MSQRQSSADGRPELHVAALPFPSYQGTQAAIRSMLETRQASGTAVELFTYAAAGYDWTPSFPVRRASQPAGARVALRSGPSLAKLLADARMGSMLPDVCRDSCAHVLVAHHVEAMTLACRISALPRVFFAHTDLAAELPTYATPLLARVLSPAGAALDRTLCQQAHAIAAISPALCAQLRAATGLEVQYVPTPWALPAATQPSERVLARQQLGLPEAACVALYAGNLDRYQDAEQTLAALERLAAHGGPRLTLLLATNSEPGRFLERAVRHGVAFRTHALGDEPVRRMLHAAADLAIVPRATPGGLPMKLLDALARGLPCALAPLAAADLPLPRDAVAQANQDGPAALAAAIASMLGRTREHKQQRELAEQARAYIATEHSAERFNQALDAAIASATREHSARAEPPRQNGSRVAPE